MRKTPVERLLDRIEVNEHGCWLWTGPLTESGYARFNADGRAIYVHRFAYQWWVGPVPAGLDLDHECRVRHCCNPDHLEPVDNSENQRRGANGRRRLVCPKGHWVIGTNVRWYRGRRICKECDRNKAEVYREANRQEINAKARAVYTDRKKTK